jgi:hypothetical protein
MLAGWFLYTGVGSKKYLFFQIGSKVPDSKTHQFKRLLLVSVAPT